MKNHRIQYNKNLWVYQLSLLTISILHIIFSSVQYSRSVVSDSLRPHGLQHARPPCPSPTPRVYSKSCPLSRWHRPHLILCRSLLLLPSVSPASGSFPMSRLSESCGQSIGASASPSVLPTNIQGWFPLGLTGLISLLSKGFSRVFSNNTAQKHQFFGTEPSLWSNSHAYMTTGKTIALTRWTSSSMQTEPVASRGEGLHWTGPCVTHHNERCVPRLAACAFPGKTSLLNGIQFTVSRRALLLMPLWLALGLVTIGMSRCSKGTMPS